MLDYQDKGSVLDSDTFYGIAATDWEYNTWADHVRLSIKGTVLDLQILLDFYMASASMSRLRFEPWTCTMDLYFFISLDPKGETRI